jgi:tetratricopeptide (TPR) repeat protein
MDIMKASDQSKKSSRYLRWTIVSCALLALLWPLGNFVFWIMLGFISYFGFFAYYYQPKAKPIFGRSDAAQQHQGNPVAALWETIKRTKSIQFAIAMGVLGFFIVWFAPNVGGNNSTDVQPEVKKTVNIDSLVDLGNERYNRGEYESALNHYDEVLQVDPTNQFGLYNKALVFYAKKDFRKSISLINYCIQQNPDYGPAYYLLGDDYKFINQPDSALYFFDRAYEMGVRDPGLLQNLGDIYYDQKESKQAIQFYKEAVEQDTTLVLVLERLAELEPSKAESYRRRAALVKK